MTDKRFEYNHLDGFEPYIYDVDDNHMISDLKIICEILNSLNDENEQLKKKYHTVQKVFEESQNEWADSVNKLHEENIQYKQELDNIYLLIGRGDWSGLVDLIKGDVE